MFRFLLRIRSRNRNRNRNQNQNQTQFLFGEQGSNPRARTTHLRFIHSRPISEIPQIDIKTTNKSDSFVNALKPYGFSDNLKNVPTNSSSFTVSYLINSCHLSPQSALSAAKRITIKSTENPDSVLKLLNSYGFTDTQIASIITKRPGMLALNPDSIIRPKLDFFLGFSGTQFARLVSSAPVLLESSLERRLKPNLDLLTSVIGSNHQIVTAVCRNPRLFSSNLETNFLPNVRILQGYGVHGPNIAKLATRHTRVLNQPTERFKCPSNRSRNWESTHCQACLLKESMLCQD